MAKLTERSAFGDGRSESNVNFRYEFCDGLTIASLAVFQGQIEELNAAIKSAYGVALPATGERVAGADISFVWSGDGLWHAFAERSGTRDLEFELKPLVAGLAAVVDHSDGRSVVRISGPFARDILAKGVPLDLHPSAFRPNKVAITHASHIGIMLWQIDLVPTYEIVLFRSFADSFMSWLINSAAEYV